MYLRDDPLFGTLQLQQHSELRAPTAERAAFYLDAAVAGRQREDGDAHMLYTLHVYQYSVAGKGGGKCNPISVCTYQIVILLSRNVVAKTAKKEYSIEFNAPILLYIFS